MEIKYLQSRDWRAVQSFLNSPEAATISGGLGPAKCSRHRGSFIELIENVCVYLSALLDFSLENTMLSFKVVL